MQNFRQLLSMLIAAPIIVLIACGTGAPSLPAEETPTSKPVQMDIGELSVEDYLVKAGVLNPATSALEEWTTLANEHTSLDSGQITRQIMIRILKEELEAALNVYTETGRALDGFRLIVSPKQCQEMHLITTESLQLQELAFLKMKTYLELALSGAEATVYIPIRDEGIQLMQKSDRVKQSGLFAAGDCFGN